MEKNWYVIHTYSGYENKVKANLEKRLESMNVEDKIFRILVPMEDEIEFKDGKRKITKRKVFPGYVLVEMFMTDESWYVVRNTPGVTGFVGTGSKPVPLKEDEVQAILKHMGLDEARPRQMYELGENVRIIGGPFTALDAIIQEIHPEKGKVKALITMFGRETMVELDYLQVEKLG
ncbi:MAG: transcription termination/antitermination protein NusG [Peptococcaceae bacterium]|jgi:transcriptional antiterminator NusG|nr:transcription termination/antitermination protein NusG [Peptococcaceae bacterium]